MSMRPKCQIASKEHGKINFKKKLVTENLSGQDSLSPKLLYIFARSAMQPVELELKTKPPMAPPHSYSG